MFAETVAMAVKGHHFFKITRNVLELERFKGTLDRVMREFEARLSGPTVEGRPNQLAELKAYRDQVLVQIRARYRKLNKDFRGYVNEAVAGFQATLDELIASKSSPPTLAGRKSQRNWPPR
jgi:hypothetical protein